MTAQCITLNLNAAWAARLNRTAVGYMPGLPDVSPRKTKIPAGLFLAMDGNTFAPTVHGDVPENALRKTHVVSIVGGNLREPMTVGLAPGMYKVMNTGAAPLAMNDRFVVEFPAREDALAQTDCLARPRTKQSCGAFYDESKALFGGFLATKKIERSFLDEVASRIVRDAADPMVLSALTSIANIHHELTVTLVNHANTIARVRGALQTGAIGAAPPTAALAPMLSEPGMKRVLQSCAALVSPFSFATTGVYLGSTFANPSPKDPWDIVSNNKDGCSETGMLFNAYMTHFQGF